MGCRFYIRTGKRTDKLPAASLKRPATGEVKSVGTPNATDELDNVSGVTVKIARLTATLAILTLTTACATERMVAPERAARPIGVSGTAALLPLLYVVDGARMQRDQVPALEARQIASVVIIKGRAALERFGADASYGVVLITTKQAASQ